MAADTKVPMGGNEDVHPVAEALGSRPDEDIVKGPPAANDARFVRVGSASDPFAADLITDALDEAEIPVVARSSRDHLLDTLVVPAPNSWDILVPQEFEARARTIVAERHAAMVENEDAAAQAAEEEEAATEGTAP